MERQVLYKMKMNAKFIILYGFFLLFVLNCNNSSTTIRGTSPAVNQGSPQQQTVSTPGYFYGNHFRVQNSSLYETLLSDCKRCGTRRLINRHGGGVTYQRLWVSKSDPRQCRNWSSEGYIQIEFEEKKLPTKAILSIWPKYTGLERLISEWGEPFEITAIAKPINENKGFQIALNPSDGLGGLHSLIVTSDQDNHVKQSELHITVSYGQGDSQAILTERLKSLKGRAVRKAFFDCQTYTN